MWLHSKVSHSVPSKGSENSPVKCFNRLPGQKTALLSEGRGGRSDAPLAAVCILIVWSGQALLIFLPHWVVSTLVLKIKKQLVKKRAFLTEPWIPSLNLNKKCRVFPSSPFTSYSWFVCLEVWGIMCFLLAQSYLCASLEELSPASMGKSLLDRL